jgi:hypothetical protein
MTQKRSKLKAIYMPTLQEEAEIIKNATEMEAKTDEELIEDYNRSARCGIYGSRAQHRYLAALSIALKNRFGDPIVHIGDGLLYLPCTVELLPDGDLKKTEFTDWE